MFNISWWLFKSNFFAKMKRSSVSLALDQAIPVVEKHELFRFIFRQQVTSSGILDIIKPEERKRQEVCSSVQTVCSL